jgi:DNA polymerase-3 subunit delta|tara:strand:- start:3323 stop:4303 length:981 start_codon:yes stop_codon:yes gene_type:complete
MIIKHYELKNYLNKNINYFLFYGQNSGLIEESINNDLKPIFSKNIFQYEESEILTDIDNFREGIFNKSFFENDKLIIVNRVSDKILNTIKEISEEKDENLKIILKSGSLEKKSKLRNFFEKNKNLIIVPFYEDTYQSLLILAQKFFRENKIRISTQNINYIVEKSKGNRINLKNELEKIENFTQKKLSIELDEIMKLTNLAENYDISELTDQCLARNKKKTLNILNENNPSPEDNILILKTFLYKLKRLKKLKLELEVKKNADTVLSSYKPPIFWKDKDIVKQQLKIWSLSQLKSLINKTNHIELLIKKNSQVSNQIINNFILERL